MDNLKFNSMGSEDNNWRTQSVRQTVVSKIEEVIQRSGMQVARNSSEMENHVFMKAKNREEYMNMVAKLILHVREMYKKRPWSPSILNDVQDWNATDMPQSILSSQKKPKKDNIKKDKTCDDCKIVTDNIGNEDRRNVHFGQLVTEELNIKKDETCDDCKIVTDNKGNEDRRNVLFGQLMTEELNIKKDETCDDCKIVTDNKGNEDRRNVLFGQLVTEELNIKKDETCDDCKIVTDNKGNEDRRNVLFGQLVTEELNIKKDETCDDCKIVTDNIGNEDRRNVLFGQLVTEELNHIKPCLRTRTYSKILAILNFAKGSHSSEIIYDTQI